MRCWSGGAASARSACAALANGGDGGLSGWRHAAVTFTLADPLDRSSSHILQQRWRWCCWGHRGRPLTWTSRLDLLRWLYVIGATVLLGTGSGIAFFMWMAHRTGDARTDRSRRRTVVSPTPYSRQQRVVFATDHRRAAGAGHRLAAQHRLDRAFAGTLPR